MKKNDRAIKALHRPGLRGGVSLLALLAVMTTAQAQETAPTPVPDISVNAPLPDTEGDATSTPLMDGSAAAGYRVKDTTAAGPIWGDLPIQDAPYSISVVPSALIENLQAYQPEDVYKIIPQITNVIPAQNVSGNPEVFVRGFGITQFTNGAGVTYDGLLGGAGGMFDTTLEDKERVELLSGVSGFLYGTGSVGGVINNVLKRPTATAYYSVTAGDNAGGNGYIHGDFGGPLQIPGLQDGILAYRLNIAGQDGHTSIYDQSIQRNLISGAFDIHITNGLLLQFNAAHSDYHIFGLSPVYFTTLNPYPAPADPAKIFSPSWAQFVDQTDTAGAKLTWNLNEIFTLRTAYDYTREVRPTQGGIFNWILDNSGTMTQFATDPGEAIYFYTSSGYAFLDAAFSTFGIQHKLTAGFTGFSQLNKDDITYGTYGNFSITNNFYNQHYFYEPPISYIPAGLGYTYFNNFAKNYILGDEIKFNDQFTILAGGNYTSLGIENFNAIGRVTGGYGAAALTPTVSLIYKPLPWLTTYATYQQSLQPGAQVLSGGGVVYTNSGTILPPYLGKQYEVGVKATVGTGLLLTAALFDIDKANQYTQFNPDGTFTIIQSGREVHKGLELTATGKVWEDLTVFGGVTLMDPRITNNPTNPTMNGNLAQFVSPVSEKLYAEYNLPFAQGLTLIGGFRYSGSYYADLPNTTKLPGFAVGDLGLRYTTKVVDRPLILRFNVNNFTNAAYWQSAGYEGVPRTFLATAEMKF